MAKLEGKCAVVTGGTRGIGIAIARGLLECGAWVFVCSRREEDVRARVESLRAEGFDHIYGSACDIRSFDAVRAMMTEAVGVMGGVDILVNNAGTPSRGRVESLTPEEWAKTMETNLSGAFYCCHEAIPSMKERGGGYIINIGSLAGKNPLPGASAYCASKFGLLGFSESLMQEVRYDHIRVSCVMPGSVNTNFGQGVAGEIATWKLEAEDVAEVVMDLLKKEPRALASVVELRPSEPRSQGS
jgi:NAD(P)-dependent dehydrogenase (short-subunit alcohol dehydrogenase family)